jgi:hypothetical protein
MAFPELVKAALDLGIIPALALFLVVGLFQQNKQLMKQRNEIEAKLLENLFQVLADYQKLLDRSSGSVQAKRSPRIES